MRLRRWAASLACALLGGAAGAQTRVEVPSLDAPAGSPIVLVGHWFATEAAGRRPAVVLLHGCGGAYDSRGALTQRMRDYAALLNAQGWHALVVDSLSSRSEKELCTQPVRGRAVTSVHRRLDALGALRWLAAHSEVDAQRLALLGWSHGGSAVLAATNAKLAERGNTIAPRAAVAYYPGCALELRRGYAPSAPLLMLVGADDDWTPSQPCVELSQRATGGAWPLRIEVYPGAHHGFDSRAPLRVRKDVQGGVNPGRGVTVGGNPQAFEASRETMLGFLREQFRQ